MGLSRAGELQPSGRRPVRLLGSLLLLGLAGCPSPGALRPRTTARYEALTPAAAQTLEIARSSVGNRDLVEIAAQLRTVLQACPDHVRTHLLYQEVAEQAGGATAAAMRQFYNEQDDPRSAVLPYMQARLAEDDDTRLGLLQEAERRDPSFAWASLSRARVMRALGRTGKALEALDAALAVSPEFAEALLDRAEVLTELRRFEEAERNYTAYLRARPDDEVAVRAYVRLMVYDLGQIDKVKPFLQALAERAPDDVEVLMCFAAVAWKEGRLAEAVERYKRVLALDPDEARAVLNLGNLWYDGYAKAPAAERLAAWAKARQAYRFYLAMPAAAERQDLWEQHIAVPFRLRELDQLLEPDPRAPQVSDF